MLDSSFGSRDNLDLEFVLKQMPTSWFVLEIVKELLN